MSAINPPHQGRQNNQKEGQAGDETADDRHGKGLLHLGSGPEAQGERHQGKHGSDGRHEFRTDTQGNGIIHGFIYTASGTAWDMERRRSLITSGVVLLRSFFNWIR